MAGRGGGFEQPLGCECTTRPHKRARRVRVRSKTMPAQRDALCGLGVSALGRTDRASTRLPPPRGGTPRRARAKILRDQKHARASGRAGIRGLPAAARARGDHSTYTRPSALVGGGGLVPTLAGSNLTRGRHVSYVCPQARGSTGGRGRGRARAGAPLASLPPDCARAIAMFCL